MGAVGAARGGRQGPSAVVEEGEVEGLYRRQALVEEAAVVVVGAVVQLRLSEQEDWAAWRAV